MWKSPHRHCCVLSLGSLNCPPQILLATPTSWLRNIWIQSPARKIERHLRAGRCKDRWSSRFWWGAGTLDGKAVLVSEGKKFQFMMKLQNIDYRGEQFIFNGDKDSVAFSTATQSRSAFGTFMFVQDAAIREGLWGGELSTAWPLLNLGERKAKLDFGGLKKIDGQDLYEVRYRPHKSSDLDIKLYFDPQTGHHVRTVYSYSSSTSFANLAPSSAVGLQSSSGRGGGFSEGSQGVGGTAETAAARQFPNRYRLEEKFTDFKTVDGVTLPTHYDIQFSQELQNGKTTLSDWDMKGLEVLNNVSLDVHTFDVK